MAKSRIVSRETSDGRRGAGRVLRVTLLALTIGCMLALMPDRTRASGDGEETSLTGEVLDAACYVAHGRKGAGPGHRRCAEECINKKNLPIALLTDKDEAVLLLPDHADERPYEELKSMAAETVTVEGKRITRGGLDGLIVSGVKKK